MNFMSSELEALIKIMNAGGNIAVAVILWVSARYLSEQLGMAYQRITEAHERTVKILTDVVGKNTEALTRMNQAIQQCEDVAERSRTAIAVAIPASQLGGNKPTVKARSDHE